ncbi:hypothetical protein HOY82DRAFT_539986 [Tuber indicum]|nr:hypothetical protein HOY82DRAFT_539986 [Tuber indicum]
MAMMLGYTNSTKIWRLWDFNGNGGKGRPVNCSDVWFIESQNAWAEKFSSDLGPNGLRLDPDSIENAFEIGMGFDSAKLSEMVADTSVTAGCSASGGDFSRSFSLVDLCRPETSDVTAVTEKDISRDTEEISLQTDILDTELIDSETGGKHSDSELSLVGCGQFGATTVAETDPVYNCSLDQPIAASLHDQSTPASDTEKWKDSEEASGDERL